MRGIWTALITPFVTGAGEIDFPAFKTILRDQREAGVAGVIPCGTTGESPTLSTEEKKLLIKTTLEELKGSSVQVIAGTGSNNTAETVALSSWASDQGVDGILVVAPYYNKPSQAGLLAHFRAVADAVSCEVMLYNVPGRSGIRIAPETVAELCEHPRIRSIKEASADPAFVSQIRDVVAVKYGGERSLDILSGDDGAFLPYLAVGAVGIVSVSSNLFPRAMIEIQRRYENGDVAGALKLHQKFHPLFRDLFVEVNPVPIKAAMAHAGFCHDDLRLPLVPLTVSHMQKLLESLERCGIAQNQIKKGGL